MDHRVYRRTIRLRVVAMPAAATTIWKGHCWHRAAWKWPRWIWSGGHVKELRVSLNYFCYFERKLERKIKISHTAYSTTRIIPGRRVYSIPNTLLYRSATRRVIDSISGNPLSARQLLLCGSEVEVHHDLHWRSLRWCRGLRLHH